MASDDEQENKEHLESQTINPTSHLVVKQSRLFGAGNGLYATRSFSQGDVICEYSGGRVLRTREAIQLQDKSYLMRLGPQVYMDLIDSSAVARYINDCRCKCCINAEFVKEPEKERALVVALRNINEGEEIFASYGRWYWIGKAPSSLH